MTTTRHLIVRGARRTLLVAVALAAASGAASTSSGRTADAQAAVTAGCSAGRTLFTSTQAATHESRFVHAVRLPALSASAYDWPLKPFNRQHPVRAFFNDPRVGNGGSQAFHFGIDIAAPDGTPVYAVESGTVYLNSARSFGVLSSDNSHVFGYWHIVPSVHQHQFVQRHQLLGVTERGWGHLHFAEKRAGRYLNPLRPGALSPYVDATPPTVSAVTFVRDAAGTVAIVVDAHDTTIPRVVGPWADEPVTPALLEWRIVKAGQRAPRWSTSVDFRGELLPATAFHRIYAPGTRQNHEGAPGRYCFYVARHWKVSFGGTYHVQVRASDTRGNADVLDIPLTVAAGAIS